MQMFYKLQSAETSFCHAILFAGNDNALTEVASVRILIFRSILINEDLRKQTWRVSKVCQ